MNVILRKIGNAPLGYFALMNHLHYMIDELAKSKRQLAACLRIHKRVGYRAAAAAAIKLQTYTADTMTIDCKNEYFRPGHGLHPKYLKDVLGKTAKVDLERGTPLKLEHIHAV